MVDEELTFQKFGYYSYNLTSKSNKKIICKCLQCGVLREVVKAVYTNIKYTGLCKSCFWKTVKYDGALSKGKTSNKKGKTLEEMYGVEKANQLINDMSSRMKGKTSPFKGKCHTEESKIKNRNSHLGKLSNKKDKTNIELYGVEKANIISDKIRQSKLGITWEMQVGVEKASERKKNSHYWLGKFGEFAPRWKGGKTFLGPRLKNLEEYKDWRDRVYERDNYTCQECGQKGGKLEAHHLKAFSVILSEFLKTYSQFSPIEDKETLVRLSISWQPFWDINNGQTLCVDCHKKTTNYANKAK